MKRRHRSTNAGCGSAFYGPGVSRGGGVHGLCRVADGAYNMTLVKAMDAALLFVSPLAHRPNSQAYMAGLSQQVFAAGERIMWWAQMIRLLMVPLLSPERAGGHDRLRCRWLGDCGGPAMATAWPAALVRATYALGLCAFLMFCHRRHGGNKPVAVRFAGGESNWWPVTLPSIPPVASSFGRVSRACFQSRGWGQRCLADGLPLRCPDCAIVILVLLQSHVF